MAFLPASVFGHKLNHLLVYTTSKHVTIHDRHLGCLYYSWCLLIVAFVVGFQVFYDNRGYQLRDVKGSTRMTIQQPTKGCNPNDPDCEDDLTPFTELPYCVSSGNTSHSSGKHKCIYADQHELLPGGMLEGKMFVPTRIDTMVEKRECVPGPENGYHCKKLWKMQSNAEDTYVADIEDYTVLIVSSYYRGKISGTSTNHQGFYYECRDKETGKVIATNKCEDKELLVRKIECLPFLDCKYESEAMPPRTPGFTQLRQGKQVKQQMHLDMEGNERSEFKPGPVFAIPDGDIFTFSKLLELAGLDLDGSIKDGESLRARGTKIKIKVEYANLYPWAILRGNEKPGYIIKVVEEPMNEMKTELYTHVQRGGVNERTMENRHGIYLDAAVGGSFGFFDWMFLAVMLVTSLGMLAVGTTIIDVIADHIPGLAIKKDKYQQIYCDEDREDEEADNAKNNEEMPAEMPAEAAVKSAKRK